MKRRTVLLSAAGLAGALVVGWGLAPPRSRLGKADLWSVKEGEVALNGWIKIAADGAVVLAMPRSEMGQGVHTALAMLVAEELELPLDKVRLQQASADAVYGNVAMLVASLPFHPLESEGESKPFKVRAGEWMVSKVARELGINATGGSSSVADAWGPVRLAAATARAALLGAAAAQWKLPLNELQVRDGVVSHVSGSHAHFGQLARAAAASPPGAVALKPADRFQLLGKATPRVDIPSKVDGSARYGIDVRPEGLLYAAIRMCPQIGGAPGAIDTQAVLGMPGVRRVVVLPSYAGSTAGVAVVATSYWLAQQAVRAMPVEWRGRPAGDLDTAHIEQQLWLAADGGGGTTFHEQGDWDAARATAARTVTADYFAPYLAHATMEPMNCTAQVNADGVRVWAPTQVPQMAVAVAARVAGVSADRVDLEVTQLGGGFGRRLEVDVVAQAVRIAMDCGGRPVQLIWSREEDTAHDFYRPMQVARLAASLSSGGQITGLSIDSAGDAITPRWIARGMPALAGPVDTPDKTTAEGLFDLPYGIAHQRMRHVATRSGVPVGFWRSVGHSQNAFISEGFIDELAAATQADPLAFRRRLLEGAPRYRAVLDLAAEKAGWGQPLPPGRSRGVALHESFGSIVAQVVDVSRTAEGLRVHRVVCAIDCGVVINPDTVAQQMESAVVFGLTAALYGRIDIEKGAVRQGNFPSYPLLALPQAPEVLTYIVPSTRTPGGVGEPGVPPLAPAVAAAWFALTGVRLRRLPLTLAT